MTLKMHFTLLAANKVELENMNKSTESDFLEFLQKFQITYIPEKGFWWSRIGFYNTDYFINEKDFILPDLLTDGAGVVKTPLVLNVW